MVFLLKCFVCIAVVIVALHWRADAPPHAPQPHARAASARRDAAQPLGEAARGLVQAGADAVVAAARDKCLAAPRECAAAVQRLNGMGR